MNADEQTRIFKEFLEKFYYPPLLETVRKGENFLRIDFMELAKFSPEIVEELLEHPEEIIKAGENAVKEFDLSHSINRFYLRFFNLPESQKIRLSEIRSKHLGKFFWTEGAVRTKSEVRPHVMEAKFECPSCGSIISKLQDSKSYTEPSRCACGRKGKFKEVSKELVDGQGLTLEESSEDLEGGEQPKRLHVFLKNDLVSPLNERRASPGTKVRVVGWVGEVPITLRTGGQSTKFDLLIEANNVDTVDEDFYMVKVTEEEEKAIKELAEDPHAYERLINSLAPSIYGHEKVKEALVLQLAGGVKKERPDGVTIRGDSHILLIGDPGSGKCLHPRTSIVCTDGSIKTIEELVQTRSGKIVEEHACCPNAVFEVAALNERGILNSNNATLLWKRPSPQNMLYLRTSSGSEIIVTPNHPFFVTESGIVFAKEAQSLTSSDFIAAPRILRIEGSLQKINPIYQSTPAHNRRSIIFPGVCDQEIARLFGYLVGDGYVAFSQTSGWVSLTNNNPLLLEDFKNILQTKFNAKVILRQSHKGKSAQECYATSIELVRILQAIDPSLIRKSQGKRIPEIICKSPLSVIKPFLQALYECEGSVHIKKRAIEISSASKDLISDLKIILLRFGIISFINKKEKFASNTVQKKRRSYYELVIYGEHTLVFAQQIGFLSSEKQSKLTAISSSAVKHNTNTDVIPNVQRILKFLRKNASLFQRQLNIPRGTYLHYELGDRNPSRSNFQKVVAKLKEQQATAAQAINLLEEFASCDIFWDKVEEIKSISSDCDFVYDLQVEEVHNYIANSLVVHNSQLLKRVGKIAPKGRYTSGKGVSAAGLTASVVKDELLGGWSLEAGALVLSNKGFCAIDEMDKMAREDTAALHEAMEQQTISISKANIQATLHAETTILAAANPKSGRFNPYDPPAQQLDPVAMPSTLLSRFDLIFPIKDLPDKIKDEKMASHILGMHQNPGEGKPELETKFLRKFFSYIRQHCKPQLTDGALKEIKDYYVQMRGMVQADGGGMRAVPITARQLEALTRLAEASAKLRLSPKVTKKDAQRAIDMIDYCLKEVAMDKETGVIDIDRISTDVSSSQRNKMMVVKEMLVKIEEEMGGNKQIEKEKLVAACVEKGIKSDELEKILELMHRSGEVFEPRRGVIQRL